MAAAALFPEKVILRKVLGDQAARQRFHFAVGQADHVLQIAAFVLNGQLLTPLIKIVRQPGGLLRDVAGNLVARCDILFRC
ncbi:hypothetical protein GGER_52790 [Serratia rubidaea]